MMDGFLGAIIYRKIKMTKKFFIDCGGCTGQTVSKFKKSEQYGKDFIIYSFEPVSSLSKHYKDMNGIFFIDKAVWIYDGEIDFYIDKTHSEAQGSTISKNKTSGKLDKAHPIKVKCIDFSKWLDNLCLKEDYVILKMDIEGAEYDILDKMICDGTIEKVDDLYVEFHYKKMIMEKSRHDDLILRLEKCTNLHGAFRSGSGR